MDRDGHPSPTPSARSTRYHQPVFSERVYGFGASTLTLKFGDILESTSGVLVSCDDKMLTMGGGVWRTIARGDGSALVSGRLYRGDIVILSILVRADEAYVDVVTGIREAILNIAQVPR